MPYDLVPQSDTGQIVEAINYLLNNLNNGLNSDPSTGEIVGPNNQVVGYLYKYIAVKYADSYDGSVNFSDSPTNRQYYGLRNSDSSVESTNPADYIWTQVTGGFSTTKLLYYTTTGGRQIDFRVDTSLPAVEWAPVPAGAIDLDVVTAGSVLSTTFVAFFQPSTLQVPYTTGPNFTGVIAKLYASNSQGYVNFSTAQTDSDAGFTNNTWRIGNSSSTGNGDISYANITVGAPTDGGGFAQWPAPTAMTASPALITVPVRYKSSTGVVSQASPASIQITFSTSGQSSRLAFARIPGNPTPISGTIQTSGSASYPTSGQSASVWGISTVWSGIDPNPSSTDSLYQSEGSYDPVTNVTTWTTPYISSLRVGTLSAITVNTGSLSVTGDLTIGTTGAIKGGQTAYNTGTGFFLGYSGATYKFSIGNSVRNLTWDGSALNVNGTGTFKDSSGFYPNTYVELGVNANGNVCRVYRADSTLLPPFYVFDTLSSTAGVAASWISSAQNNGLEISSPNKIGLQVSGNNFVATPVVDVIGSRQENQLRVRSYAISGSFSTHAGRFQYYNTSGTLSTSAIAAVANGVNAFYAEVGSYGPFTGSHDAIILKTAAIVQGDIVVDVRCVSKPTINETLFEVTPSSAPNVPAIGVYVASEPWDENSLPAALIDTKNPVIVSYSQPPGGGDPVPNYAYPPLPIYYNIKDNYANMTMNALGEGLINVCGEGGNINSGDLIVTSSIPGKGMKQADDIVRSITVAKARESVTFSGPTEVKQVACIYLCG